MSVAAELRDIARRLAEISAQIGGDDQVETVKKVFGGHEVQSFDNPQEQRQALSQQQAPQDGPKQVDCKFCGKPVFLQQSKNGKWYTTESPKRNDFHQCSERPSL